MEFSFVVEPASTWAADVVVFFAFKDSEEYLPGFSAWMASNADWVSASRALRDFSADLGSVSVIYGPPASSVQRVMIAGLGSKESFGIEQFNHAVTAALRKCRELKLRLVGLPLCAFEGLQVDEALTNAVISIIDGLYSYDAYKTENSGESKLPERIQIFAEKEPQLHVKDSIKRGQSVGEGLTFARDLVNAPPNLATPVYMAEEAKKLAKKYGFKFKALKRKEIIDKGMGAFASVFRGSTDEPRLVTLEYAPKDNENDRPLVLVGKGVTFDSGGISLKPSNAMDTMKCDMSGAAAILGFFAAIGELAPEMHIVGILPFADNMPDASATRPGEVVTSYAGKTIEILNTDAEGRLLLCDSLAYSSEFQPAAIIDLATLTGGCIVAFGTKVAAVMDNNHQLGSLVRECGMRVGERYWPMPLWDMYKEELKSSVADIKNIGSREGMTIHAGMFLKEFVPENVPWVHLDIAGPAWAKSKSAVSEAGGTGFGVKTLVELIYTVDLDDL
ncbi:leucyl aminopeptidase [Maridesulfovibrio bastinii]|uniref:leucyl aminopeptidase n=1 Tax=Maridesulfovibrio bastinii TaxID=47157 RepID=UPI00041B86C3|nr:leucyl aminopeptidase [Maridesulfovibrio bastinii]